MIYIPVSMKIGTGILAISRFSPNNLNGCEVGITDEKELCSAPLRWA
jgi:hypothetical protein